MSLATSSTLLLRTTISRLPLRLRDGYAVATATRLNMNPAPLRAGYEHRQRLQDARGYASQPPPGGMGGAGNLPNFLFQQPRQKGETLKEYVNPRDTWPVSMFTHVLSRAPTLQNWRLMGSWIQLLDETKARVAPFRITHFLMYCRNSQDNSK